MDLNKKKQAISDKKISGIALPVIKATGNKIKSDEKKILSNVRERSVRNSLKGDIKYLNITRTFILLRGIEK